jgi:hypothetical protein
MDEIAVITIVIRLLLPLLILRFPLIGVLLCAAVDVADYTYIGGLEHYQTLDKLLDTYYLSFAAFTVFKWKDIVARRIALGAFAWRIVGVALVLFTDQRWLLMLFPNFFEPLFVFYLLFVYLSKTDKLMTSKWVVAIVVTALLVPKLVQEYILHIYQPSPSTAPAWAIYIVDNFAWVALPAYLLPLISVLLFYIWRAKRRQFAILKA